MKTKHPVFKEKTMELLIAASAVYKRGVPEARK
jgi:hypothetical protein